MHGIVVRATILHLARRYIAMKTTTQARIQRTAAEAVGSIPGIEAVVLFGSRARGTARAASDWDVAILSHANSDDERAARRLFGELEQVSPIVMQPESIEEHCNQGLRIESAIARQGRLLAGDWTPPPCRSVDLDVKPEDFRQNLDTATRDLRSALVALCDAAFNELLYVPKVVEESQQAAEALAKTIIAGFGLSPVTVHDLDKLAAQLENAYRGRTRDAEKKNVLRRGHPGTGRQYGGRSYRSLSRRAGGAAGADCRSNRMHAAAPDELDSLVRRATPRNAGSGSGRGTGNCQRSEPHGETGRFRPDRS